jgi:hypothetical protein
MCTVSPFLQIRRTAQKQVKEAVTVGGRNRLQVLECQKTTGNNANMATPDE